MSYVGKGYETSYGHDEKYSSLFLTQLPVLMFSLHPSMYFEGSLALTALPALPRFDAISPALF
jgi:hypothetical protein